MARLDKTTRPELGKEELMPVPAEQRWQPGAQALEWEGGEPLEDPLEEPPEEPPGEQRRLMWAPKMTWSSPRQKNRTGPHVSKDAVEEPPKGAWTPQMQTQGETPHEMGQVYPDRG